MEIDSEIRQIFPDYVIAIEITVGRLTANQKSGETPVVMSRSDLLYDEDMFINPSAKNSKKRKRR